jgi:hypothetical protein
LSDPRSLIFIHASFSSRSSATSRRSASIMVWWWWLLAKLFPHRFEALFKARVLAFLRS